MRQNPKITFFSIQQINMMVVCAAMATFLFMLNLIFENSFVESEQENSFLAWYDLFTRFLVTSISYIYIQQHYIARLRLAKGIDNFDVKEAKLSKENDRIVLLRYIRELFEPKKDFDRAQSNSQQIADSRAEGSENTTENRNTTSTRGSIQEAAGIHEFNQYVREEVPKSLPVSGWRFYSVFWYAAVVLQVAVYNTQLQTYDIWAYEGYIFEWNLRASGKTARVGWRSVAAVAFDWLVIWPVSAYPFTALVRFFLWLQHLTKLKYWVQVAIFLPIFLVVEQVISIRPQFIVLVRTLTSFGVILGNPGNIPDLKYMVLYNPLYGIRHVLPDDFPHTHVEENSDEHEICEIFKLHQNSH